MKAERAATSLLRRKALAVAVASCFAGYAYANPANPNVMSGAATFAASGKNLNVTNTPGAIINWQGFSVKADELTRFIQQNAQSAVLNRVTGQDQSAILGQLLSNGRVYLINPNGITIGAGAHIDTAGFVASSLNLSDGDALAGKFKLQDTGSSGKVVNNGTITTTSGGFVYLVAPNVENNGIITSPKGEIILAAGKSVELVDSQKPELRVLLTAPENTAINVGKMIAEAGSIGIFAGAIKQSGLISANSAVVGENGKIMFKATKDVSLAAGSSTTANGPSGGSISIQSDTGTASIAGVVEANGTQGKGGTIAVAAPQGVTVEPTARVSANGTEGGSVTLASSGGSVTVSAPVSANATVGLAGQIAVIAATTAALTAGQLSASGGQGGGTVSIRGVGGVTLDAASSAQASGATGGTVSIASDQGAIASQGTIDVTGIDAAGGNVQLAARSDITLDVGSQILAGGRSGGQVYIEAREGTLLSSGLIDGQGSDGQGGRVLLLAPRVGMIDRSVVNVSGRTGGGTVLVGGDYQGKNPDIQDALQTYVGPDAHVVADAVDSGNGGKVIVWANENTRFYGAISARGGAQGGDGGFSEVSGKGTLDFSGSVDLSAPNGLTGTLLLDPTNIFIATSQANANTAGMSGSDTSAGTGAGLTPTIFAPSGAAVADSLLTTGSLQLALLNSRVLVTTANADGGAGAGNITVVDAITAPANSNGLTLRADNNIALLLSGHIDFSASTGNVALAALGGTITTAGGIVKMGGGSLLLKAGGGIGGDSLHPILTTGLADFAATTGTGGIFVSNSSTSSNVNITSITNTDLSLTPVIGLTTTASGDIQVTNTVGDIAVSQVVTTASGNIILNASTGQLSNTAVINAGAGTVAIISDTISLGAGVTGNGSITLQPSADTVSVGIGSAFGTFNLTNAQVGQLTSSGSVTIGRSTSTVAVTIADAEPVSFGTNNVTVQQASGGMTVATNAITGSGVLTFVAGTGLFTTSSAINGTGAITITADNVAIGANIGNATAGAVRVQPFTGARSVNIASATSGGLDITDAEVAFLTGSGANTGTLTIGAPAGSGAVSVGTSPTTLTVAGTSGLTFDGDASHAVTMNGGLMMSAATPAPVTVKGAVTLGSDVAINTSVGGGGISFTGNGTIAGGTNSLTLNAGSGGAVSVAGAVSSVGTLTIVNSGGTTFSDSVSATTVDLQDTASGKTIAFQGNLTATSLTVAAGSNAYNVALTGATGTIDNLVTFNNGGTLALGATGGTQTYNGGITATAPSATTLKGTIATSDDALLFGPVTLGANTVLNTHALTTAGDITLGAVTGATFDLSLTTGHVAGADISGTTVTNAGTLTIADVGTSSFSGAVSTNTAVTISDAVTAVNFLGAVTTPTLNVAAGSTTNYNVALTGATGTIDNLVTFNNSGNVAFGNSGDALIFTGGVTHAAGTNSINGNITATDNAINLNNTTAVGGDSTLAAGSGLITLGATTIADSTTLTLGTGGSGGVTVASLAGTAGGVLKSSNATFNVTGAVGVTGTVGTDFGTVTVTNAGGITFQSTVVAKSVVQNAGTGDTTFNGDVTTNGGSGVSVTTTGSVIGNGSLADTSGAGITLTATGNSGDINIAAGKSVISTGGSGVVTLNAGRHIALGNGAVVATTSGSSVTPGTFGTGTGAVSLNASQAAVGNITLNRDAVVQSDTGAIGLAANNASGGTITMTDVSGGSNAARVLSSSGAVTLSARTNVLLGAVSTGSTVGVTATTGSISDNTVLETIANITGTNVTLSAGGAIGGTGAGADIDTSITAVTATAGSNVVLRELSGGGDLTIGVGGSGISTSGGGDISVRADAGSLTVTGPISANGNLSLQALGTGSDITISNNITGTGVAGKTATLQADRNIVFNTSADISTTNALNVVLNSDLDANGAGAIQLNNGTVLNSKGGSITLGGGAAGTGASDAVGVGALVEGIKLDGAQLVSGAGTITLRGTGLAGTTNAHGVSLSTASSTASSITSTSGLITVTGVGGAGNGGDRGIYLTVGSSIASGSGLITLRGTGNGTGASNHGIELAASSITSTGTTAIQMTGTGAAGSNDILASGASTIGGGTASGDILLNGTTTGGTVLGTGAVTLQTTGNVTLNQTGGGVDQTGGSILANGLRLLGVGAFNLNQTANNVNVLVADLTGATTSLSYRDTNGFSIGSAGPGGLTTVKTAGVGMTTTNGITVGTAATAANTLTLNAYGAVTQTTSDNLTAGGLQLLGSGPYTLSNAGNDVTTFAANVAGNISYRDTNAFTVGIVTDAPSAVSTTGISTTGAGTLTLDNGGVMTIAQNISTDGAFAQISLSGTGTVSITSRRSISTTGDAVSFASPVTLNGAGTTTTIDTRVGVATGGDITFQNTLNATTAAPSSEALTLNAGTGGNVLFTGAVGAGSRLGAINITNANNVTESAGITAASLTQAAGQGTTTFNGAVNTNTATGVNLTGNAQTVNAGVTTTGNGIVTFSNAGLLTLNADISADGAVTQNGAGVVTIDTDRTITTTADAVSFATGVTLNKTGGAGLLTINTTSGNAAGANITFSGRLDGTTAGVEPLTLNAGTGGNILFTGAVGSGTRLGAINITNANNVTESAGITAASLTQAAGQGTTTFNGAVNTNTATGVNLTGNVQTVNAGITTTGNGIVTFSNAGLLTLNGDIAADEAVTQNGAGVVTITAPRNITTTSDAVNFLRAVTLNGGASRLVSVDTRVGGGAGGDITFQSTLDATTAAANAEALTLNAGTGGNILFTGAVGAGSRLGAINLTNANNVTESAGIAAASLTQAAGQGTTTFNSAVNTNTATGVNLTGNAQTVNAGITTTGNGIVTFSNAGLLTLNADISSDGAVTQNGAGVVTINTDRTITTTADAVGFATDVTLNKTGGTGLLTINTTNGNAAGNDITFSGKLDGTTAGAEPLTLNAGTGGNILFTGAVGATGAGSRLGAINLTNANNVTESAGITVASLTQAAGQGTTTFNGAVNTNTATGVNLTGNVQTVNAGITTTGDGIVTFSNAGLLTLNGDIAADGAVTQNGAATVTIAAPRSITTTSDAVNFLRAVTLNGGASGLVSIDTRVGGAAGGDITFQSTLDATTAAPNAETLTLNAGTGGNILFTGAVGAGSRLGAINITKANDVTESAGIVAASLTQAAGQGTTTFNSAVNTNTATGVNLTGNVQTVNAGVTTTGNGIVTFSNAGLLTLNADISADGAVTQNGAGVVTITAPRTITTTADAVGFATDVTLNKTGGTGLLTINTTSGNAVGNNITFGGTLDGTTASAENLTITAGSGGNVTFNGAVGQTTRLGDVLITKANDVTVQAAFNAKTLTQQFGTTGVAPSAVPSAGTTTINGAVDTTGNTSLTTSGALNVSGTGSITAGAGSTVTLTTGGDMTLSGSVTAPAGATLNVIGTDRILTQNGGTLATTNSAVALIADEMVLTAAINSGSGAVTLKPNNPTDAIQLGVATAATNNAAATLELSNSELNTITTTGGLIVGAANNTGAITVVGALTPTTAQNGFTLQNNTGGIAINAPVTYAAGNGNLTLTANGSGAAAGAITTNGGALDVSGTLAMNAATGVGTLASPMVLSHAAGTTLTVTNTTSGGVFERADSGDLNVTSISNSAAASGGINLNVGTNLNINGKVQNTIGDVQLVTGDDTAYTGAGGFGLSPASVAVGTLGGLNINGQVIVNNGGAISIFSTGAVKQSAVVAAGLQSIPAAGSVAQGTLRVRTFNSGTQVAVIDLQNNIAGSGNSMGPITLEARLAGSINPPPYAESNIEYRSINGTNISGIGTAADFSLVAPSQTINLAPGASLSGANVSLIATAGDVTLMSAITNAQINGGQSGGSLNLYASGNIVLNNPGGSSSGVVIGRDLGTLDLLGNRQFEKFDHTLKLVATGDVRIYGTVEVTGDLALRANASASEASGPGGVAGFGAGSGSVIIAGSAGNPVEVRAQNIVVGVKDASGNPLPVQNLVIDNSGNTAGTGGFFDTTLRADKKLDIYLNGDQGGAGTSGNIVITGGTASAISTGIALAAAKSSALAAIRGEVVTILGIRGGTQITQDPDTQTVNPLAPYTSNSSNITLNGGTATSDTTAGGGALAAADALILGTSSKFIDIGGNLVLLGGTADSKKGGQALAGAKIDPVSLRLNTGGYVKLIGGTGAGALAAIVNSGDMEINIGGKFDYTYTDATGEHTVKDVGLLLAGGIGSGLFDRNNQPIKLYYDVSSQVLLLFPAINGGAGGGSYFLNTDVTKATAFIQSLSPRGFDESLMSYIIFAANEETRTGRIRTGISTMDDSSKPSCN